MSKSLHTAILPSEEKGWDIWEGSGAAMTLSQSIGLEAKSPKINGSGRVYLPIADFLSRVEEVYKGDAQSEISAVKMALEVEMNVESQDVIGAYPIQVGSEKSHYMGVFLAEDHVKKEWKEAEFDLSARAYAGADDLLIWREHERWVFALYQGNEPIWFDVLGRGELAPQLGSLMSTLVFRLQMLGVSHAPSRARVEGDANLEECSRQLGLLTESFTRSAVMKPKATGLELIPGSVKNWKRQERNNRVKLGILALVSVLAIFAAGYLFYERQQIIEEIEESTAVIEKYEPIVAANNLHIEKWNELELIIAKDWPLEVFKRCVVSIPGKDQLIFEQFEVNPNFVMVRGKATKFDPANMLKSNLRRDSKLKKFKWNSATAVKTKGVFTFSYEGTLIKEEE